MDKLFKSLDEADAAIATAIIDEVKKGITSKADIEKMFEEKTIGKAVFEAMQDELTKATEALTKQGLEMQAMKENAKKNENPLTVKQRVQQFLIEKIGGKSKEEVSQLLKSGLLFKTISLPIDVTNHVTTGYIPFPELESTMWDSTRRNIPFIREFANVAPTSSALLSYISRINDDGGAAATAEGSAKTGFDFDLRTYESTARKITTYTKYTLEAMMDIPSFMAELEKDLIEIITLQEETSIFSGAGAPDLTGILTVVPGYTATGISKTTSAPNNFDAIEAAWTQIVLANYRPNAVFVNPKDMANMKLTTTTDGIYFLPPFTAQNGMVIEGVPIIPKNQIAAGYFLIGDMSYIRIRDYMPLTMEFGYVNDDFTKNLTTVRAEKRLHCFIKYHELDAFVYDTFATVKSAIDGTGT